MTKMSAFEGIIDHLASNLDQSIERVKPNISLPVCRDECFACHGGRLTLKQTRKNGNSAKYCPRNDSTGTSEQYRYQAGILAEY